MVSTTMMATKWTRFAGFLALGAVLHGMGIVAHTGSGIWTDSDFDYYQYFLALEPGLPGGVLPIPLEAGWLHEASPSPVVASLSRPHLSRGPPA